MEGWYSTRCRLTWKLRAMKSHRFYFQLRVSTLPTKEIEFGLLLTPTTIERAEEPEKMRARAKKNGYKNGTKFNSLTSQIFYENFLPTPVSSDATTGAIIGKNDKFVITKTGMPRKINQNGTDGSVGLARLGKLGMLLTPTAQDFKRRGPNSKQQGLSNTENWTELLPTPRVSGKESYETRAKRKGHKTAMSYLESNIEYRMKMFPTPTSNDAGNSTLPKNQVNRGSLPGEILRNQTTGKTSQLNPRFVMEMMGFPPDWTELPFLNSETKVSKQEGMQ